jgi:hypothetical protein
MKPRNAIRAVRPKTPTEVVLSLSVLVLFTFGCGGASPGAAAAQAPRECAATLMPRNGPVPLPAATPARNQALSQLVVHIEVPLPLLGDELEGRLERRLAEGRFNLGPAGNVRYSAERGAVTLSVRENQLVVQTPVHARAEACHGERCYASCVPEAIATATVPLLVRGDYGFESAKVTLRFTRGCKVKALGGFLTVDVTPTLANELQPVLAQVASRIDQQLPSMREDAARIWQQLSMPRELPLGGCLVLQPHDIVQGPIADSTSLLHARFAVLARPELRTRCLELPSPSPLPALERDLSLPDEGKATLGLVAPLEGLRRAFASAPNIATQGGAVHVNQATLRPLGDDVVVELALGGALCGELAFAATPSFTKDGAFIGLDRPKWLAGERARVAAQDLDPDHLLRALAAAPRLPPLLSVAALQSAAPPMAKMLSTPDLELSAEVSGAHGAGAAAREAQLVAWVGLAARLDVKPLRLKKLPFR